MAAKTPLETLEGISVFRPFIELPDLLFDPQVKLDGPLSGHQRRCPARSSRQPVRLPATEESVKRLAEMQTDVVDQSGRPTGWWQGLRCP